MLVDSVVPWRWHVLLAEPNRERIAAARLVGAGITSYVPLIIRRVIAKGRVRRTPGLHPQRPLRSKVTPMFPGYVFAVLPVDGSKERAAKDTDGIRDMLKFCGSPAILQQAHIDAMKITEVELRPRSTREERAAILAKYRVGQQVTLLSGPFAQMLAEIETLDDRGRVGVLLSLFGRQTRIECDPTEIVAA